MQRLRTILQSNSFILILFLTCIIFTCVRLNVYSRHSKYSGQETEFNVKVLNYNLDKDKLTLTVQGKEKIIAKYYIKSKDEYKLLHKYVKLGNNLKITGALKIPTKSTIFNTFDYRKYLRNNNIFYILKVDKMELIRSNSNPLYTIKNNIINRINKMSNNEYLRLFILGDKSKIDYNAYETYKDNGITHLFAISGMHISLFLCILKKLFNLLKINSKIGNILIISFITFYLFLTNFSASMLRATMFLLFLNINKKLKINLSNLKVLIYTILILLIIKPDLITNIGFLYSATATFGLMYSNNKICNNYFYNIFITSLVVSLFVLPITLYNFYQFNVLSIINNLIFIPLVTIVLYPLSIVSFIFTPINHLLSHLFKIMESISLFISNFSINIYVSKLNILFILIYYLLLLLLIRFKKRIFLIMYVLLLIFVKVLPYLDQSKYIYYLDVKQGDCIVLKINNKVVMMDTGGQINYNKNRSNRLINISDNVITFLKSIGINKINTLILSHGDYDHMGEAINLVNNFKVEKVIFNCGSYNDLENKLIKVLNKKKIKHYACISGLNIDKYKLNFLQTKEYSNENDNSNVIYTNIDGVKTMFMGDAGVNTEKEIMKKYKLPDIDILKVGHHGSDTSSSKEFVNEINPNISIISVGKNNRYGHPKQSVLDTLNDSKIYRTDLDGSIEIKINKGKYKIKTCSP